MNETWKTIEVELDLSKPEGRYVVVERNVRANHKEILWKRKSGTPAFNFVALQIVVEGRVLSKGRVTNYQQELRFANNDIGDEYSYVITVEGTDRVTYTTTEGDEPGAPGTMDITHVGDGDKPVIRNR